MLKTCELLMGCHSNSLQQKILVILSRVYSRQTLMMHWDEGTVDGYI